MKRIYLNEFNIPMENAIYLPLVSGLLQSYAEEWLRIEQTYEFMPFLFIRDTPENILSQYDDPYMACFSVCIWNHRLSLAVAQLVKDKFPDCLIVFGGPQVKTDDHITYPFIDYIIEHEGEKKFLELLGVKPSETILDHFPSPYPKGLYDQIINDMPEIDFQVIVETNRGCPFSCSFCYWGQGFAENKIKFHSLDYIREEAEWIGRKKIKYVFMADANFGMYPQDIEVAKIYRDVKEKYGYPEKVRVCYGKNKEENVFETAKILSDCGLSKAITLAKQSEDQGVLDNIQRSNIKKEVYSSLEQRYKEAGMTTYSEIILGLPGETKESFKKGVDDTVKHCNKLFVYHCTILPNTGMAEPEYIKKYGLKTVQVPLAEIHSKIRPDNFITEYEDIVIETNTLSKDDWMECAVYAWIKQLYHTFGVEYIYAEEEYKFHKIARDITNGKSRAQIDKRFGNIYWEPEELAFLRIATENGKMKYLKQFAKEHVLYGRKENYGLNSVGARNTT